jgi:hypothetical protein
MLAVAFSYAESLRRSQQKLLVSGGVGVTTKGSQMPGVMLLLVQKRDLGTRITFAELDAESQIPS